MKDAEQKLNNSKGFTLAETLVTVLILLMVSAIVAGGIPVAAKAYNNAVDAANAQVLLSTTVNALRDKLSTAWNVAVASDKKSVTYISSDTGSLNSIDISSGVIEAHDYLDWGTVEAGTNSIDYPLISESAKTRNLQVSFESVDWSDNTEQVLVFSKLEVKKSGNESPLAQIENLYIRLLCPELRIS